MGKRAASSASCVEMQARCLSSFVTTFRAFVKLPQTATDEPEAQIVSLKVIKHKQYLTVLTIHTHTPDTPMCDNIQYRQSTVDKTTCCWSLGCADWGHCTVGFFIAADRSTLSTPEDSTLLVLLETRGKQEKQSRIVFLERRMPEMSTAS